MGDIVFSALLNMGIWVVLAISLNLINGFTGMFSLGHAAFAGIGAYAAAVYMNAFSPELYGAAYWAHFAVGAGLAMLAAGALGVLVGVPCLRLAGDYLAIATLAFAEIFRIVIENAAPGILGGARGLRIEPGRLDAHWGFLIVLAAIVVVALLVRNLKRSATGRAFQAIRENEIAAETMGMNTAVLKVEAFVIGSALAGLAGALFAFTRNLIAPSDFSVMLTIMVLLMIVLGGQGSLTGSIVGAVTLSMIDPLVRYLPELIGGGGARAGRLGMAMDLIRRNPQLIYALLLIVLIRIRPQGMFGTRELGDLFRRRRGRAAP